MTLKKIDDSVSRFNHWVARSSWWKSFIVWYVICLIMNAFLIYMSLIDRSIDNFVIVFKPMAVGAIVLVLVLNFMWLRMVRKMVEQEKRQTGVREVDGGGT